MAERGRVLSSQLHRLCIGGEQTLPGWVCVCLPARHRRRPVFGGETSGCLEIDFPPTTVCIFLLRVVFRCSRQTLGLETFLFFFFFSARSVFSRPFLLARLFTN